LPTANAPAAKAPSANAAEVRHQDHSALARWHELTHRIGFSPSSDRPASAELADSVSKPEKATPAARAELAGAEHLKSPKGISLPSWKSTDLPFDQAFPIFPDDDSGSSTERQPSPTILKPVPIPDEMAAQPAAAPNSEIGTQRDFLSPPLPPAPVLPPAPDPIADRIAPQADDLAAERDLVFRPITQIQPFYNYSPTGKEPGEYRCPRSGGTEKDPGRCPGIRPLPAVGSTERFFPLVNYNWLASNLHHKPLYFEDIPLERYGHKFPYGLQPFVSVGRFGVQLIGIPYQMALDPVCEDVYALGYYRPGDCAPKLFYQIPYNLKAAAAAGGVYAGLIFLIP
jgi:hypothetical protein